jgi:hypothetical protein
MFWITAYLEIEISSSHGSEYEDESLLEYSTL